MTEATIEKKFKQVTAALGDKHRDNEDFVKVIKYIRKSFMFCDMTKLNKDHFETFITTITQSNDVKLVKKTLDEYCFYLKSIRDEQKVKSFSLKSADSPGSQEPTDSSRLSPPTANAKPQPTEKDLQQIEQTLKHTEISLPPTQAPTEAAAHAAMDTAAPAAPLAQSSVSAASASKKRKAQLIPVVVKEEQKKQPNVATPFDDLPFEGESNEEEEESSVPSKVPRTAAAEEPLSEYLMTDEVKALEMIEKMDKFLVELSEKIKDFERQEYCINEVTDENERHSIISKEDGYKKQWAKVYKKFTELCKKYPHLVDVEAENLAVHSDIRFKHKVLVRGSKYPIIDQKVCDFVNKTREVPNFPEVFKIAEETSKANGLNLSEDELTSASEILLKKIITLLKNRRKRDEWDIQRIRTEELQPADTVGPDPAENDAELKKKLEESKALADLKTKEIVEKYTKEQGDKEDSDGDVNDDEDEEEDDDTETQTTQEFEETEEDSSLPADDYQTDEAEPSDLPDPNDEADIVDPFESQEAKKPEPKDDATVNKEAKKPEKKSYLSFAATDTYNESGESEAYGRATLSDFLDSNDKAEVKENLEKKPSAEELNPKPGYALRNPRNSFPPPVTPKTRVNRVMPLSQSKQTAMPNSNMDEPIVID